MTARRKPAGLGAAGGALWRSVVGYSTDGATVEFRPDEVAILVTACRTADTVAAIERALVGEPLTVEGSAGQQVLNPLVSEVRFQRAALAQLLGRLRLPDAAADGGWDGLTASQRARKAARSRWSA